MLQVGITYEESHDRQYDEKNGLLIFNPEVDRVHTSPLVLNLSSSTFQPHDLVYEWASSRGLSDRNQRYLSARVKDAMDQIQCPLPSSCIDGKGQHLRREICLTLDDGPEKCSEVSSGIFFSLWLHRRTSFPL